MTVSYWSSLFFAFLFSSRSHVTYVCCFYDYDYDDAKGLKRKISVGTTFIIDKLEGYDYWLLLQFLKVK